MLGNKQPEPDLGARNFIGQQLTHLTFQALGIGRLGALFAPGTLSLNKTSRLFGVKFVEFFFEGRNQQRLVQRCEC